MEKFEWMPKFGRFIVKLCLVSVIGTGIIGTCNREAQAQKPEDGAGIVERAIWHIVKGAPSNPAFKAKFRQPLANDIDISSAVENVEPLAIVAIIFRESSFRRDDRKGKLGEKGLGQQHGRAARGCDFSTQRGQVDCTAKWFAYCMKRCGTVERAFAAYISKGGNCNPASSAGVIKGVRRRMKLLNELRELK